MNTFNAKKLEDYYEAARDELIDGDPSFYKGVDKKEMLEAYNTGQPINWLDEFFRTHTDRTLDNILRSLSGESCH